MYLTRVVACRVYANVTLPLGGRKSVSVYTEYIVTCLNCDFIVIVVFNMLDLYVLPKSMPIPIWCGTEYLTVFFIIISLFKD